MWAPFQPAWGRWQDTWPARAELEHYHLVQVDDGRGRLLYRNGAVWRGGAKVCTVIAGAHRLWVQQRDAAAEPLDPVAGMVGRPDTWPDPARAVAEQGRSGLQHTLDRWLRARRAGYVAVPEDALGRALAGSPEVIPPERGADVVTTLDMAWQREAEAAIQRVTAPVSALVVLDVKTGDVLAMAGRDTAHPLAIPAVRAQVPGSVFKLVTAMAALDSHRFRGDSAFECAGRVTHLPGVVMRCWRPHGRESFLDALAQSCDVAFAEVGVALGRRALVTAWHRLDLDRAGLLPAAGLPVLSEAEGGVLFRRSGSDPGLLANSAIGQEDVRLSPLQAARIAAAVADGGVARGARLVLRVEQAGETRLVFPSDRGTRVCSAGAAALLAQAMREAVTSPDGTAHGLASVNPPLAVKTGTAQLPNGRVNAWMAGFLPAGAPRVAFCVFAGDVSEAEGHRQVAQMTRVVAAHWAALHGVRMG